MKLFIACALFLVGCHTESHHHASLTEAVVAMPIKPGQTAAWQHALEDLTGPRYDEYRSSRERFGLTAQTTFLQQTPMGDFAVIHVAGPDVRAAFHAMGHSQDRWDIAWRELTTNLHGIDFAKAEPPRVELAYQTGPDVDGPQFLFVVPIDATKLRALAADRMGAGHAQYVASRQRAGIAREAAFYEHSVIGDALVIAWRCADAQAALAVLRDDPLLSAVAAIPLPTLVATIGSNRLVAQFPK